MKNSYLKIEELFVDKHSSGNNAIIFEASSCKKIANARILKPVHWISENTVKYSEQAKGLVENFILDVSKLDKYICN